MNLQTQYRNKFLNALPEESREALVEHLEPINLQARDIAYEPSRPVDFAYFPESSVISIVASMEDNNLLELATVGIEGMVGLPILFENSSRLTRAFCQIPGSAHRVPTKIIRELLHHDSELKRLMLKYAQILFDIVSRNSACSHLHTIEKRCARWMLLLADRLGNESDTFPLTQEFLAEMLGVQRTGVNMAAGNLQKAELITYVRGKVTILNREGLESVSCECYNVIKSTAMSLENGHH